MRRMNSEFKTANMSEEGQKLSNRDYFGYVEMDDFACYVLSDSLDEEPSINSARLVVESIIRNFTEAPSMGKRHLQRMIRQAHTELQKQKKGMHLKASIVVVVTDYRKIRYAYVGNSRYYLIRNARIMERTEDQSLTSHLAQTGKIPLDQAASHEERNNLYSFLGERGTPKLQISKKKKLENGDIFLLITKGVWEQCPDENLLEIINDAKDPDEILKRTEDWILERQETEEIDNYTMVVTFAQKVYQSPKKPWTLKRVLMIAIPVVLVTGGISLALFLRYRSIRNKEKNLMECMENGEAYLRYDNYQRAAEEYGEAKTLAGSLNRDEEYEKADQYKKLAEQVILADEALSDGEYEKSQELYLTARELSEDAGNVGRIYIESQLDRAKDYIEVYDLIALGERKEEYGNLTLESTGFPVPCKDHENFEYIMSIREYGERNAYLMEDKAGIRSVRQNGGRLLVTGQLGNKREWDVYMIKGGGERRIDKYEFPIMENIRKDDFVERFQKKHSQRVKTKGELERYIRGFGLNGYIEYQGCQLADQNEGLEETYSMNFFIHDEIREQKGRRVLILLFKATGNEKWLARDIASFIVSEVQELYPEYHCEGKVL